MSYAHKYTLALAASVSILFVITSGCHTTYVRTAPTAPPPHTVEHAPPPHAPEHEFHRKYTYVHYPSCNLYCDHERKLWFWLDGHEWKMGAQLPGRFRIEIGEGVKIELDKETPFEAAPPPPPPKMAVEHGPPPHAFHRKFTYVHYPSCNVYRDHERKLWFWYEGNEWRMGAELPARFHVDTREGVEIELDEDTPYRAAPSMPAKVVVEHGPPPHAPAHGFNRKFTYVHYPSTNVYCDRERNLWFWREGSEWKSGANLPARFRVDKREEVKVELDADTPYEHASSGKEHGQSSSKEPSNEKADAPNKGSNKGSANGPGNGSSDAQSDDSGKSQGKSQNKSSSKNQGKGSSKDQSKEKADSPDNGSGNGSGEAQSDDSSDGQSKDPSNGSSKGSSKSQGKGSGKDKEKGKKD